MRPSFRAVLMAGLLAVAGPVSAQQYLNLRDADIRAFIEDAARVTGRNIIVDPDVEGTVSVITEQPLSRAQYFEVFLETLRANDLVAIPLSGGGLRISNSADAARQPAVASDGRFVTRVVRLEQVTAAQALEAVAPLISAQGQATASGTGNALVIADYQDNLARVLAVLAEVDRDDSTIRLVPLSNAGAREIAAALGELARAGGDTAVSVVPVDSSNSVILRGDPQRVSQLAGIVAELDARAALGADVRVFYLEHADAQLLLPVLQQIAGQTTSVATVDVEADDGEPAGAANVVLPASGERARAVIARYEGANALIVSAAPDLQRTLGEVIRQLDQRREQVLVEAIVAEVSDNAARALGVEFLLAGLDGTVPFASTNYSNSVLNPLAIAGAVGATQLENQTITVDGEVISQTGTVGITDSLQQAAAQSLLGVSGGLFGVGGVEGDTVFGAILNAVKSDTTSNILSVQSLMTLDNQVARYLVGQEVPVTTGEALSENFDNAFRTVERQNVGIQLEVRPQINAGGAVKLFLKQEVSSIAGPVSSGSADLVLNTREIETTITVDDGDIVALGGLLDENERKTIEKIPLLGDIPVLGELFTSRSREQVQTNLMVFIRPRIIRSREDAQEIAAQRYNYQRASQLAHDPDSEPALDRVLRTYLDTVPPGAVAEGGGFAVDLAGYANAEDAAAAQARLGELGPGTIVERGGAYVLRLGPVGSAEEAARLRGEAVEAGFPRADILPLAPETVTTETYSGGSAR
ncbi:MULTISPECIES: type II secretion system secretin GspD [Pacificimonas]|uniref:type II secretion system secretin GspD n=1 Tax=Pacificimonas TaxID=1960290 RepID=UPI001CCEDB30|nr:MULTISPECIES: type II secretion system secretin GspD [Pacificimonas]